ncbi:MAG: MBL fold metallo-hydrolase [Actinomycetota bacterium]|nr:MBL fold metallo-hydrolase [Actinomycetota bacterium]
MKKTILWSSEVAPDVYAYVQGDGGWGLSNAGLVVGQDEALLVDTFFDLPSTYRLYSELPVQPTFIVNTHYNGDHCWGNEMFVGARIVAHAQCREQLLNGPQPAFLAALLAGDAGGDPTLSYLQQAMGRFDFEGITVTPPTEVFDGGSHTLDIGGRVVELFHYGPAHTLGDCVVWVPDQRVLFTGDLLFWKVCPLVWDGTVTNWLHALDEMLALDPAVVVPGHGPVGDTTGLVEMAGYFRLLAEQGRSLHDAGVPVEEAAARLDLGSYASWVDIERTALNLLQVYRELDGDTRELTAIEAFSKMAAAAPRLTGGCC